MKTPIVVPLDYPSSDQALAMADRLDPRLCRVKVGKELFTRTGPKVVDALHQRGFEVFLDLKFHDIPNTVAGAVEAAASLGVWMVNVHAGGGRRMMEEAANRLAGCTHKPLLIGVTVLTSLSDEDLAELGYRGSARDRVFDLASLAASSGLDGVVCSAQEAGHLRERHGAGFCLVTPGIRPTGSSADDQRRVVTPAQALSDGSDYLVIGRPITQATDPVAALESVMAEVAAVHG